ncbi:hypothetical protein J6590_052353 [Homalodisca vitripennis]|nr:hypothetical protein J6590_052353 [Homalodisca vitripennis]
MREHWMTEWLSSTRCRGHIKLSAAEQMTSHVPASSYQLMECHPHARTRQEYFWYLVAGQTPRRELLTNDSCRVLLTLTLIYDDNGSDTHSLPTTRSSLPHSCSTVLSYRNRATGRR